MEWKYSVETSSHFVRWTDPESGVVSYLMKHDAAPFQQSFYYTNRSWTDDGRYLWIMCAFPPAGNANYGRTLAVLDFETDRLTHFCETQFSEASPVVDLDDGTVYWCNRRGIYRRSPDPEKPVERVAKMPSFASGNGIVSRLATHMTFSPDKKRLCFDAAVGNRVWIGDVDLSSGNYDVWYTFDCCRNHAQLNPVYPDWMLFAEDMWSDVEDGTFHDISCDEEGRLRRLWTMKKGEEPRLWRPLAVEARHEWWSADGNAIYYVDWDFGTIRIDTRTGESRIIDPNGTWHAHATADERYIVADENELWGEKWYRGCDARVHFYNTQTQKQVNIVTHAPALYTRQEPCVYHMDPHPQFCRNDTMVMYTTTVGGGVSVAVCDVAQLIQKSR